MDLGVSRGEKSTAKAAKSLHRQLPLEISSIFILLEEVFIGQSEEACFSPPSKGCFSNFAPVIPKSSHVSRGLGSTKGLERGRSGRRRFQEVSEPHTPAFPRAQSSLSLPLPFPAPAAQLISGGVERAHSQQLHFYGNPLEKIILFTHDTIV